MEVLTGIGDPAGCGRGRAVYYLVRRVAAVTGSDLRSARVQLDENNMPAVGFTLNSQGAATFARVTGENIGRYPGDRARQDRAVGAGHRTGASRATVRSPAASRRRRRRTSR